MNENAEKLKDLKADLERVQREHMDILSREPKIGHPLDEAADQARRIFKTVNEGRE